MMNKSKCASAFTRQQVFKEDGGSRWHYCGGEHPRHYSGCPAYFPLINKIRRKSVNNR